MSNLALLLSKAELDSRLREAQARRRGAVGRQPAGPDAVIRPAVAADRPAIERLAQLEGRQLPDGAALVAERGAMVLAAVSLESGEAIANPFRPTAHLVALLLRSRAELRGEPGTRRRRGPRAVLGRLAAAGMIGRDGASRAGGRQQLPRERGVTSC